MLFTLVTSTFENRIKKLVDNDDSTVITVIYNELSNSLYRYLISLLYSKEKTEDVMQETFITIAKNYKKLANSSNIKGYIFSIAKSRAIDLLRRETRMHERNMDYCDNFLISKNESFSAEDDDSKQISQALLQLAMKQREVVVLKVFDQMTFNDIAKSLKISPNTAASRYRYGLARLKNILRDIQYEK